VEIGRVRDIGRLQSCLLDQVTMAQTMMAGDSLIPLRPR